MEETVQWLRRVHDASELRHGFTSSEVRIAYMSMGQAFRKHVDKKMAPTHAMLLFIINEYPNSSQQKLSEIIGLQRSTIARTMDEFEKRGWAKRAKKSGDRRSLQIKLTSKGKKLVTYITPKLVSLDKEVETALGKKKKMQLMKLLKEFQDAMWNY